MKYGSYNSLLNKILFGILLIVPLVYSGYFLDPSNVPRYAALSLGLALFASIALMAESRATFEYNRIRQNRLFFGVFAIYLAVRMISITYSRNPSDGIFEWSKEALGFCFLFLLCTRSFTKMEFLRTASVITVILAVVFLSFGGVQLLNVLADGPYNTAQSYRITSLFGHRNLFAQSLFLFLPFFVIGITAFRKILRWVNVLLFAICSVLIFVLLCRAVWVAFAFALIFTMLALAVSNFTTNKIEGRRKRLLTRWFFIAGGTVAMTVLIIILALNLEEELFKQIQALLKWDYGSARKRIILWTSTWQIIQDNMTFGVGMAEWKIDVLKHLASSQFTDNGQIFFQRPHNDFLWIWAESGLLAVFSYSSLYLIALRKNRRAISNNGGEPSFLPYIAIFAITGYVVMAFFSFPMERMESHIFLAVFFFMALGDGKEEEESDKDRNWNGCFKVILLFAIFALYLSWQRSRGEIFMSKALDSNMNKEFNEVIAFTSKAESSLYLLDPTSTPVSWYRGMAYYNQRRYDMAMADLEKAYGINPYHVHVVNNLAAAYYRNSLFEKAESAYREYEKLTGNEQDVLVNLAVVAYSRGFYEKAVNYLQRTDSNDLSWSEKEIAAVILHARMQELIGEENRREYRHVLLRMNISDKWLKNMLFKSAMHHYSFEGQVNLDVQYVINLKEGN